MNARSMAVVIAVSGLLLLASACGGGSSPGVAAVGTTTTSVSSAVSTRQSAARAFSRCMRSHGVPNFPDPDPQGHFPPFHTGVSKPTSGAANDACKHLLPRGGGTGTPQQRQEKFTFALKIARCLRTHGFRNFPDPTASGQVIPHEIDTDSPRFQAEETACEQQARQALGLP